MGAKRDPSDKHTRQQRVPARCMIDGSRHCAHVSCAKWAELGRAVREDRPIPYSDWLIKLVGAAVGAAVEQRPSQHASRRITMRLRRRRRG